MSTIRKTITVTDQQDDWIKSQIEAGRYTNDSECVRDLIRREQERSAEIDAVVLELNCSCRRARCTDTDYRRRKYYWRSADTRAA